jgi:hypothetical protein
MIRASLLGGLLLCLFVALVVTRHGDAVAQPVAAEDTAEGLTIFAPPVEALAKKCSFNSDCAYGKCTKGQCGGCSFNSDCKGWGKCSKGRCGSCGFDSDCKGFGKCSSGRCSKSPY